LGESGTEILDFFLYRFIYDFVKNGYDQVDILNYTPAAGSHGGSLKPSSETAAEALQNDFK
jgi:hypothetical protein